MTMENEKFENLFERMVSELLQENGKISRRSGFRNFCRRNRTDVQAFDRYLLYETGLFGDEIVRLFRK